jgi:hypothetical protein
MRLNQRIRIAERSCDSDDATSDIMKPTSDATSMRVHALASMDFQAGRAPAAASIAASVSLASMSGTSAM